MTVCFLSGLKEVVGQEEVSLDYAGRLSGLLLHLCHVYGDELERRILVPGPDAMRSPFVKILVDGRDVRSEDPVLQGGETVFLFLPIAGG